MRPYRTVVVGGEGSGSSLRPLALAGATAARAGGTRPSEVDVPVVHSTG